MKQETNRVEHLPGKLPHFQHENLNSFLTRLKMLLRKDQIDDG